MTLEEELREGGKAGDGCTCVNCRAADSIAALEARCREQQTELDAIGRHSIKEQQQRIDELEAVLHRWLENDPYPGRVGGVWDATERVLRVGDYAPETKLQCKEPDDCVFQVGHGNACIFCGRILGSALETPVRQAHSKSEYKRLMALGVDCTPPETHPESGTPRGEAGAIIYDNSQIGVPHITYTSVDSKSGAPISVRVKADELRKWRMLRNPPTSEGEQP